ncbi:hypothetical protein [Modestobacter versicolor]|uniref:hypothetical protein n=1 Tax=Modestobacter versicolor TaxID=429133 RepID=UPI0034DFF70C
MPSALLDAPRVVPTAPRPGAVAGRPRRMPAPVFAVAALAVLESLALLALGLTSLDGVFGTGIRPDGGLVATTLLLLAGWVVLCAGGGATLVDGAGRSLVVSVAWGEIVLLLVLTVAGVLGADGVWLVALGPLGALPVPALALLALGVPTAKLLLATSTSAVAWVAAGGRPRTRRAAPRVVHRGLRTVTVVCIGVALTGVALLGSTADPAAPPTTASTVAP